MRRIWVDHWQIQCCGDPFSVGRHVKWSVTREVDGDWFAAILDPEVAATVTDAEEHHASEDMELFTVEGVVRSIRAVYCRYEPAPGNAKALFPVRGSGWAEARDSADGWEPSNKDGEFIGYLVDVEES